MKLLVDMNLSPRWVDLLTRSQFEAVHWSSVGSPHALDQEIMAYDISKLFKSSLPLSAS
jgi:predicted nuclease of predicted toxin-antitoxin system